MLLALAILPALIAPVFRPIVERLFISEAESKAELEWILEHLRKEDEAYFTSGKFAPIADLDVKFTPEMFGANTPFQSGFDPDWFGSLDSSRRIETVAPLADCIP